MQPDLLGLRSCRSKVVFIFLICRFLKDDRNITLMDLTANLYRLDPERAMSRFGYVKPDTEEPRQLSRYSDYITGWTTEKPGYEIFLLSMTARPALGPTQSPVLRTPGAISARVKRPEREADHSHPSSAEVKNGRAISPFPHTSSLGGVQLIKLSDNVTFTLNLKHISAHSWSHIVAIVGFKQDGGRL
jgi:hypothetical protein